MRACLLGLLASLRLVTAVQGGGWSSLPLRPTVGDTVWLERTLTVPAGWRLRPGHLESSQDVEPVGDPGVRRSADGWTVRYPVVAWTPGPHTLTLPPIWRLGPAGEADSLAGGTAAFAVRSVLPDAGSRPAPKDAMAPLRPTLRSIWPPLLAALLAGVLLGGGVWWRRRAPRALPPPSPIRPPHVPLEPEVPDDRWLAAGEPKAVAVRATRRLRMAVAAAIPKAHHALATAECLAAVEREAPKAPVRELRDVLGAMEQVAFATAHGADVAALAQRARRLAAELQP
jgi:hypothetical protein